MCLEVEEEGEIIFAGGFDPYCIYVWSSYTGKIVDVIQGHQGPLSQIVFSQMSQTLITASWDKTVRTIQVFSKT